MLHSILFAIVLAAALGFFANNVNRLIRYLRLGKPENRFDNVGRRITNVLKIALGQTKLLREPFAGLLHALIFWGFVVLLSAVIESIIEGLTPGGSLAFLGPLYPPLTWFQDLFGAFVVVAVVVSLGRRLFAPPKRLQVSGHSKWDAIFVLAMILMVMITMFGQNATRPFLHPEIPNHGRFLSSQLSVFFSAESAATWYYVFFWGHMVAVLGFLNYLPYSKHLHVIASTFNVYFSNLGIDPKGALKPINLADETLTKYGATDVDDLTWKQLLNGYTCTECGRCTSVCPANTTGKLLNPKKIMVDVRARTLEKAPLMIAGNDAGTADQEVLSHQLLDNFITEQELFACTTCMACVQECPVMIEHVDTIMDLRRGLVLNESRFPAELTTTFNNLERNYTPWAFGHSTRADWAEGLDIPRMSETPDADVLFWVGCAGSYDARYKKVSQSFAQLMKMAGVKFAILGTEEKCNGDAARRMGNEYLAQTLMQENIATLNNYGVKKIVTTCPHCLQSLGKEYKQFGGNYDVIHHSTFLRDLVEKRKLRISPEKKETITFHDPCYLGRYNDEYDAPRELADAVASERIEMQRTRDKSFCCGAGGGQMWMEEREGKRVNIERTEEALATGASTIGTGCPFCMTMMTDGVKAKDAAEKVQVKDVAELLLEAVQGGT
ncbi:MAG: (Fe-S)-binding protein [Bacteroidetes bacterium]|nr:(Fe-S)-binding protein [Bacteroidota bacterium]MCW5894857.1 (Fe-S)-binding protein [Bacteroidota bacterium]